jgi:hypothetical protein
VIGHYPNPIRGVAQTEKVAVVVNAEVLFGIPLFALTFEFAHKIVKRGDSNISSHTLQFA